MPENRSPAPELKGGLAAVGVGAFAVVCCAAFPLLVAVAGGVALGAVLGIGAGALAAVALVALVLTRVRRRRACESPAPAPGVRSAAVRSDRADAGG